ncbi:MAG TPA: hypothetical protein DEF42_18670 [Desulfosporosinus sp.]|nr:hypothetical protein [Desulfosporosinus sp.]
MRSLKGGLRIGRVVIIGILLLLSTVSLNAPGQVQAQVQANRFAQAINDNNPRELYSYLLPEIQGMLGRDEFVKNFAHERSYPYLTPLYIYLDNVTLDEGKRSGEAIFTVASRLPGEKMKVKLYYLDQQYYMEAFREIADGSFIEKFKKIKK